MSAETLPELSATPSSGRSNRRAAGIAVLAFAVFSGADALIKLLGTDLPAPQITLITTIVGLMLLLAARHRSWRRFSQADHLGLPLWRAAA
ncbi:hypothetical protein HFO55_33460 [Rhizobium leguminosarum]|uniref:hypothetical protein n=1 Tax=Rhizobium leguminosarum TaxID=384 RepID=UPI001C94BF54|nr:hypothetical protein [Rhizobium leguminosarum]MBY5572022.1 hypothetical protein [Rhizobium leguminosarum]MBY5578518.1 hypothetical protein [Rhizobium leguminosarum]